MKKNWGVREGDFLFCEGVWVGVSEILRFSYSPKAHRNSLIIFTLRYGLDDMMSCADFFLGVKIHVTHCTSVVIC